MIKRLTINEITTTKKGWLLVIFISLILVMSIIFFLQGNFSKGKDLSFTPPKRQNWNGLMRLPEEVTKLGWNLNNPVDVKNKEDNLRKNEFIQKEFERQINEIERISNVEDSLQLEKLKLAFQDYSNKRLRECDLELKKKVNAKKDLLNQDLQQKSVEINNQIKKYYGDLRLERQADLANLQLELVALDVNSTKIKLEQKKKIQLEIDQIRTEISQKGEARKEILLRQLREYEQQRRDQVDDELKKLKAELQTNYENDIAEYRAKLEGEFNEWRAKQAKEFQRAIEIRRAQK